MSSVGVAWPFCVSRPQWVWHDVTALVAVPLSWHGLSGSVYGLSESRPQ